MSIHIPIMNKINNSILNIEYWKRTVEWRTVCTANIEDPRRSQFPGECGPGWLGVVLRPDPPRISLGDRRGLRSVALAALLAATASWHGRRVAADGATPFLNPMAPKAPPWPARAKSVIFLFMYGGPSHVDTFDYKPNLYPLDGKTIGQDVWPGRQEERGPHRRPQVGVSPVRPVRTSGFRPLSQPGDLRGRHGFSPLDVCRVAPARLGHADDELGPDPERQPLPGLMGHLRPGQRKRGPTRLRGDARPHRRSDQRAEGWSSGYMPAAYQATVLRSRRHADPRPGLSLAARNGPRTRLLLDRLRRKNEEPLAARHDNSELAARIASYELGLPDAELGAGGRGPRRRIGRDPGTLRRRSAPDGRLRPQVPDRPAAGRAGRAIRADLLRRLPQRQQLGRPRRPGRQPHEARRPHGSPDRRADRRPQAPRACSTRP